MASKNYVNNKDFLNSLIARKEENERLALEGKEKAPISRYLGHVVMEIARRLAYRPNFINYSYREDLIGDAIEVGLKGLDKFDCSYENPFAYITQIMWNAFIRRIQIENGQQAIKGALIADMPLSELFDTQEHDEDGIQYSSHIMSYLRDNNFYHASVEVSDVKTIEVKDGKKPSGLEVFFE